MSWPVFNGYPVQQHRDTLEILRRFFEEHQDILRVVELGTWHGGMSLFLGSCIAPRGGRVLTIDRDILMDGGYEPWRCAAEKLNVVFLRADVHGSEATRRVSDFIRDHRALVLCDDSDSAPARVEEIDAYAKVLKPGDYLLAHDYRKSFTLKDLAGETTSILHPYRQEDFPNQTEIMSMRRG